MQLGDSSSCCNSQEMDHLDTHEFTAGRAFLRDTSISVNRSEQADLFFLLLLSSDLVNEGTCHISRGCITETPAANHPQAVVCAERTISGKKCHPCLTLVLGGILAYILWTDLKVVR